MKTEKTETHSPAKKHKTDKKQEKRSGDLHWVVRIFCISVALSAVLNLLSNQMLDGSGYLMALAVLVFFVLLGIVFDIVGVAVTAADMKPFHSMAAHKEKGAAEALRLLKSADKVSNFCNDVVGDICGIVSGATAAVIVSRLQQDFSPNNMLISLAVTALVSGFTIGGKALGKGFAMRCSTEVVYGVGKVMRALRIGTKK